MKVIKNVAMKVAIVVPILLALVACGSAPVRIINYFDSPWTYAGTPYPKEISQGRGRHLGIDIQVPDGEPVYAAAGGVVFYGGVERVHGCGIGVAIRHRLGYYTQYCHLRDAVVTMGDEVDAGALIGHVGRTGAWGNVEHLHFEVHEHRYGTVVDPLPFIRGCIGRQSLPPDTFAIVWPVRC
jgi:murein DD-endopeptidase MepM/ murein hydrolase activator NlpD